MKRKEPDTPEVSFFKLMMRLKKAGLPEKVNIPISDPENIEDLEEIQARIGKILGLLKTYNKSENKMIYFIMYDIEHNKIRNYIAKYLLKKGCTRIQKSVFIANSDSSKYREIQEALKKVQEMYENNDSIFFVPVSTDEIKAMKIIGKSIDFDYITGSRNTLFI